jgi:subtilisin family serine protease
MHRVNPSGPASGAGAGRLIRVSESGTCLTQTAIFMSLLAAHGCRVKEEIPGTGFVLATFDDRRQPEEVAAGLARDGDCLYAHPNHIGEGGEFIPDDTYFPSQWHLDNTGQQGGTPDADIDAVEGWSYTRGSAEIIVAVLDSGIDRDHPDLVGRSLQGYDFVAEDDDPEADHSHGPVVTGLLAASANNAFAVAGVDHHCTILPVKVLASNNMGTTFDLVQGVLYAAQEGAHVVSMSLINYPDAPSLRDALATARASGAILVACGGNNGLGGADVSWPGASEHTLAVGWTDRHDARSPTSGTGNALDLVAPGVALLTIQPYSHDDLATTFSGCSAATPIVAGIVSLCLSLDPTLDQDEITEFLILGAEDQVGPPEQDTPGWDPYFGHGRVNLARTLALVAGPSTSVDDDAGVVALSPVHAAPNPFRGETQLRFSLPAAAGATVAVYGLDGRRVRRLSGQAGHADGLQAAWDGRDDAGVRLPAGIYLVRAEVDGWQRQGKVILLR